MTKPDKPIEAQGLGCGLVISVVGVTAVLCYFGVPPGPAMIVAMVLAALSIFGYMVNQFKSQKILDETYKEVTAPKPTAPSIVVDGEGKYRVLGVDKASGMDTTWYTPASSAANAKIKGELQGIIVTEVTKV